jgi:hypothetical protein
MNERKNEETTQESTKDVKAASVPAKKLLVVKTGFKAGALASQNLTDN